MTYPFVQGHDYGPRKGPANGFVIHLAEGGGTVGYLAGDPARGVSVHYVIEYSGRIVQMLRESSASGSINPNDIRLTDDTDGFYGVTANRAVMGDWWRDPNSACLSVEIEGFAANGPNAAQHGSLKTLVTDIRTRHPLIGLLGHRDFADYKACPGKLIHWEDLGGHGKGDMPGFKVTFPTTLTVGKLVIPKGTPAVRLSDSADYIVPVDVTRDAVPVIHIGGSGGFQVDLNGDEAHFVSPANPQFTPSPALDCSQLVLDAKAAEHERVRAAAIKAAEAL